MFHYQSLWFESSFSGQNDSDQKTHFFRMDHFHLLVTRRSESNQVRMLVFSKNSSITSLCYKQEEEIKPTSISLSLSLLHISFFYAISCYVIGFFGIKVASNMEPNEEKSTNVTICLEDQIQMEISCKHHLNSFYCLFSLSPSCGLNLWCELIIFIIHLICFCIRRHNHSKTLNLHWLWESSKLLLVLHGSKRVKEM